MNGLGGFFGFFGLLILVFHIGVLIWGYNDAQSRGKSGCLVLLLFFLLPFPANLIIWLLIRPEHPNN